MIAAAAFLSLLAVSAAMALNVYRAIAGPDVTDRILALDTMAINATGLVVLAGIAFGTTLYFEAALLIAVVGFVSTVAFCRFLLRGNVIE